MEGGGFWVGIAVTMVLGIAAGVVLCLLKRPARVFEGRGQRMRRLAEHLGLRYYGSPEDEVLSLLPPCSLFAKGRAKSVANLMAEERKPPRVLLFDYGCVHASPLTGDRPSEYDLPVSYLVAMAGVAEGVRPTPARIYWKDWFGGPVGVKGQYGLQFEGDEAFGRRFAIAGEPREAVSAMLTRPVREAIKSWPGQGLRPVVEIGADWVTAYVESEPGDNAVGRRAAALVTYACGIARALGSRK